MKPVVYESTKIEQSLKIKNALFELRLLRKAFGNSLNVCILYHADCNDGMTSAAVVIQYLRQTFGKVKYKCFGYHYGTEFNPDILSPFDACFIVDFSFSGDTMVEISSRVESCIVFDHHKTAVENLDAYFTENPMPENLYMELSQEKGVAGANLTWGMLGISEKDAFSSLVFDVADRDTWMFSRPNSKATHLGLLTLPKCTPDIIYHTYISEGKHTYDNYVDLVENGKAAQRMWDMSLNKLAETTTQHTMVQDDKSYKVFLTNCPYIFTSDLSDLIMQSEQFNNETDICCTFVVRASDVKLSFRSKNKTAHTVAKFLGGGGHPDAAGAEGISLKQLSSMFQNFQNF